MDYKKIYESIVGNQSYANRKKGGGVYYESHHIVPKCMGGGNENSNKVLLTGKEHFICHKLLHYIYPNNGKISLAYHSMAYMKRHNRKLRLTAREYEEVRIAHSLAISGEKNVNFGKPLSQKQLEILRKPKTEEHKKNISISKKGKKASEETKKKQSESRIGEKNNFYNKKHTQESIKKQSDSKMGENNPMFNKKQKPESILKTKESKKNRPQHKKDEEKRKRSEANRGENNPMFGKKQSEEAIAKRVQGIKRYWEKINEEKRIMIF